MTSCISTEKLAVRVHQICLHHNAVCTWYDSVRGSYAVTKAISLGKELSWGVHCHLVTLVVK